MRNWFVLCCLLLAGTIGAAPSDEDVPNLQQPREKIYTAGQPTKQGLQEMVADGVKTVVNLRQHSEKNARDEAAELKAAGALYINIPVTAKTLTLDQVKELACVLRKSDKSPVLVHCGSGSRVGALWLLHRVLFEKAEESAAIEEARAIGLGPELETIVLELLEEYGKQDLSLSCR